MAVTQPDLTHLLANVPVTPGPFSWPHRRRHFTYADADAMAASIADRPVTDGILFPEIWKRRTRASMVTLEEGVMDHRHHCRIRLAGDAVHKFQPSLAMGGAAAMESVTSLIGHIQTALVRFPPASPSSPARRPSGACFEHGVRRLPSPGAGPHALAERRVLQPGQDADVRHSLASAAGAAACPARGGRRRLG